MTVRVTHPFTSTKPDGDDPTQIQPSHWNDEHAVQLQGPALLGRKDGTDADAQEIHIGAGLLLDEDGLKVDPDIVAPQPVSVSGVSGLGQVATAMLAAGWSVSGWQWQRVLLSTAVQPIAGATSAAYVQQAADVIPGIRIYPQPVGLTFTPTGLVAGGVVVPVPLAIAGTPVLSATVGTAYAGFTVVASGGTVPYSYSLVNAPSGMAVNASSGVVTYPTPALGTYNGIVIRVTDGTGAVASLAAFNLTVAAAAANSKARFGTGSATAGVASPAALLAAMTEYGTVNASKAGAFNVAAGGAGVYGWAAIAASASAGGVVFTDSLGTGGWQGASSAGNNGADPGTNPNTSVVTFTDANGVLWRFFRMNYANAGWNGTTS